MVRKAKLLQEKEVKAEDMLVDAVKSTGGLCKKLKFVCTLGAPDRLVLLPDGRFFFVELKSPTGPLQPSQINLFPKLERLGFPVYVLRGTTEVSSFIETHLTTTERQQ